MLVKCPSCNTEYNCEPGKYHCACGAKFIFKSDGSVFVVSEADVNSRENMSFPGRMQFGDETDDMTIPMPGISGRKRGGRFNAGELILGRYMVLSELRQGSMGVVYKCFDETAGMVISVEALPPDLSQNARKMEEVKKIFQLVSNLHHPKIACCNALEMDRATGSYYLIMECIEGEDLRRWIERMRGEGGLTLKTVLPVIRQIASALDCAHGENVFILDLKPGSIMVDQAGQVKMPGFGLAEQIPSGITGGDLANPGPGDTAPYMAPEQWNGNPRNAATDQYALAVLTYEMLAGHLPFDSADEAALRQAVLTLEPDPIASLPEQAQAAIGQAMSKDPANRFLRCSDFVDALEGKTGESSAVPDSGPIRQEEWESVSAAEPPQPPERRNASAPPRREPSEQEIPGPEKKRGRKAVGILFALVAITAVILLAFYKRNEIPGLSGFDRTPDGEQSGDASDLIFDEVTTSAPSDRVRTPDGEQSGDTSDLIFDEVTTSASSDSVRPSDGEQPGDTSGQISDDITTSAPSDSASQQQTRLPPGDKTIALPDEHKSEVSNGNVRLSSGQEKTYELQITTTPDSGIYFTSLAGGWTEMYSSDFEGKCKLAGLKPGRYMVRIIRDKCLSSDREFELKGNMVLDLPLKSAAANDDSKEYEKLQGTVYLLNPLSGDTLPDPNEKGNRVSDEDKVISSLERFVLGSWRKSAGSSGKQSYPELDQVFKRQQAPGISYFYQSKRIWNIGANYFQCGEKVGKYGWAAVYSGFIVAPFSGKFRFHGYCDDAMVVRFNRKIVLDFGCKYNGYCSDMTRTVGIGHIDPELRKIYDITLETQLMCLDAVHSGIRGYDLHMIAADNIARHGYGKCFGHGLGHGFGLEIHEQPRASAVSKDTLLTGMTITIEPGIYLEGKGGVRIEDCGVVTKDGYLDLVTSTKELIIL